MRHKISKAPAPTRPLPAGGRSEAPQLEPPKQPPIATSIAAQRFRDRFFKAYRDGDRANAEFYADQCKAQGLPEPYLTEVFHLLDRLLGNRQASAPTQERQRGRRPEKFEKARTAMLSALRRGEITPDQLNKKLQKELVAYGQFSFDTLNRARQAALSEFVDNSNSDK